MTVFADILELFLRTLACHVTDSFAQSAGGLQTQRNLSSEYLNSIQHVAKPSAINTEGPFRTYTWRLVRIPHERRIPRNHQNPAHRARNVISAACGTPSSKLPDLDILVPVTLGLGERVTDSSSRGVLHESHLLSVHHARDLAF